MSKIFDAVQKSSAIDIGELNTVDSGSELERLLEEPTCTVCAIPAFPPPNRVLRLRASTQSPIFPSDTTGHPAAEQYRIIRTKLLHNPKKPKLVVVSSASSGDGKTTTSINIAGSLSLKSDFRVLLVDGDLRHSRVADELDLPITPGLTDVLSGTVDLDAAIIRAEQFPNLFILPAGTPAGDAAELLDSPKWHELLEKVRVQFESVIFDAPPVATVADYELLQISCDGVIFVVRPDHSDRAACMRALETIPEQKLLGVVLNDVENWWLWKTPAYGYYRSQSSGRPV